MEINLPGYVAYIDISDESSIVIPKNEIESMEYEIAALKKKNQLLYNYERA